MDGYDIGKDIESLSARVRRLEALAVTPDKATRRRIRLQNTSIAMKLAESLRGLTDDQGNALLKNGKWSYAATCRIYGADGFDDRAVEGAITTDARSIQDVGLAVFADAKRALSSLSGAVRTLNILIDAK